MENRIARQVGSEWIRLTRVIRPTLEKYYAQSTMGVRRAHMQLGILVDDVIRKNQLLLNVELLRQVQTESRIIRNILIRSFPRSVLRDAGGVAFWEARQTDEDWVDFEIGDGEDVLGKPIPAPAARKLVGTKIKGLNWSERFSDVGRQTKAEMRKQLALGMGKGESIPAIARRLRIVSKTMGRTRALLIARTEVHNVSIRANEKMFYANRRLLVGVEYLATLDDKSCLICGSHDREIFYYPPVPEGESPYGERPFVPLHPRCRCVYAPFTRYNELFGEIPPADRASMFGPVKGETTYKKWLAQQSPEVVRDIMGKGRAKLYLQGKVGIDRFVNDGRERTLEQLEALQKK